MQSCSDGLTLGCVTSLLFVSGAGFLIHVFPSMANDFSKPVPIIGFV